MNSRPEESTFYGQCCRSRAFVTILHTFLPPARPAIGSQVMFIHELTALGMHADECRIGRYEPNTVFI